jgi:hypothetical protein
MATLCLADDSRDDHARVSALTGAPGLRDWLGGDWALLFSHPDDFQCGGFEYDRWLAVMRAEFQGRGVRPLAVAATNQCTGDGSWVGAVTGDWRIVKFHRTPPRPAALAGSARAAIGSADEVVDLSARLLRADLVTLTDLHTRFVVIMDSTLRRRGLLRYRAEGARGSGSSTVSPLDLLASVEAMRRSSVPRRAAA